MLVTLMFLVVAMKSRTFFSFSCSANAGAGRQHSQTESQAGQWKYSIPWKSCSIYKGGLAMGQETLLFYVNSNPLLARSSNFSGSSVFVGNFVKSVKSSISGFRSPCLGTGCESVINW